MVGTGLVLLPIIPEISMYWPPKVAEFPLAIPVLDPVTFNVD